MNLLQDSVSLFAGCGVFACVDRIPRAGCLHRPVVDASRNCAGTSSGFNLYSPTFVRGLRKEELSQMAKAYGRAVCLAREAGFDAVE